MKQYEASDLDYHILWTNNTSGIQVFPLGTGEYKIILFSIDQEGTCHNADMARYRTPDNLLKLIHKENLHPSFSQFKLVEVGHDDEAGCVPEQQERIDD